MLNSAAENCVSVVVLSGSFTPIRMSMQSKQKNLCKKWSKELTDAKFSGNTFG
jgi:hypothetical protein